MSEAGLTEFQLRYSERFFVEMGRKYLDGPIVMATEHAIPVIGGTSRI